MFFTYIWELYNSPAGNLLGYQISEQLNQDGLQKLTGITFTDDASLAGRLRHSPAVLQRATAALSTIQSKCPIAKGLGKPKQSSGIVGFVETNINDGSGRLGDMPCRILSSEGLSAVNSGRRL